MSERKWQPLETAPFNREVEVRVGRRRVVRAKLVPDASMDSNGDACDQWWATTDKYPPCWSEGACWESNVDEQMSAHPDAWRELAREQSNV